jgi:hypothetical protein
MGWVTHNSIINYQNRTDTVRRPGMGNTTCFQNAGDPSKSSIELFEKWATAQSPRH